MPFLSSSGSFTRYGIVETDKALRISDHLDCLMKHAFRDIDEEADERSCGWVCFDDWLDPAFHAAPPEKAHYLAFSLRQDTRRVAPAVLKKHLTLALRAEKELLRERGKTYVTKDRKQEIKEQVAARLMSRALPIPAYFEVVWNLKENVVLLATTNSKIKLVFEEEFTKTFGLNLEPMTPYFQALRHIQEGQQHLLDELEPTLFARR